MANRVRNPALIWPGDLTLIPQPTARNTYQALNQIQSGSVATSDFPLRITAPQSTDLLRFDGTHWVNQSWLPGPFGIGAAAPSAQLLTLWPTAARLGLVVNLAAGTTQNGLEVRDATATALVSVGPSGLLTATQGLALSGGLTVTGGPFTVDAAGNVTGAATTFNSLAVSGSSSLGALTTPSLTTSILTVTGASSLNGGLTVTGGGTINGGLSVDAAGLTVLGGGSFGAGVGFAGSVTITGAVLVKGGLESQQGITADGLLLALTNAEVSGSLLVLQGSTLSGAVACQNGLTVQGSTTLAGVTMGSLRAGAVTADSLAATGSLTAGSTTLNSLTVTGSTTLSGGLLLPQVTKIAAYSLTSADYAVFVDASTGAVTITLPTAVGSAGRQYVIKRTDSSSFTVTVATTSSQTIDGSSTASLIPNQSLTLLSNNSNWYLI